MAEQTESFCFSWLTSLENCPAEEWNSLCAGRYPFLCHEFLIGLERQGCLGESSGWVNRHVLVRQGQTLVGILPLFEKHHSYGEYVFDWSWADAYHRYGVPYYPKWISAAPYTPASGPRFLGNPDAFRPAIEWVLSQASSHQISSYHLLLPNSQQARILDQATQNETGQLLKRISTQFHWQAAGETHFDEFLNRLTSRKRKNIKKERSKVYQQGIQFNRISGKDIDDDLLLQFDRCYRATYDKRGMPPYLTIGCFREWVRTMADQLTFVFAFKPNADSTPSARLPSAETTVAAALFFHDQHRLYGRYWGCLEEIDGLHFECCYYQGIELAIELGLSHFDPGTQGEHKISRGFEPLEFTSYHYIAHPEFRRAIGEFILQEQQQIRHYMQHCRTLLPYKQAATASADSNK